MSNVNKQGIVSSFLSIIFYIVLFGPHLIRFDSNW